MATRVLPGPVLPRRDGPTLPARVGPSPPQKRSTHSGIPHLDELLTQRDHLRDLRATRSSHSRRTRVLLTLSCSYNWMVFLFTSAVVMAQVFCIFAASFQHFKTISIGRSAVHGPTKILGDNDRPYTDRCIACVRHGRVYKPTLVRDALGSPRGIKIKPSSSAVVSGYRVISRDSRYLSDFAAKYWKNSCSLLDATLSNLVSGCNSLGYAVTASQLHVVDERDTIWQIANSLPVLILPVADNALYARYVLPSSSGSACILRLEGAYETLDHEDASILGVDRLIMESNMQTWLGIRTGRWRHGWLEDADTGMKWYSDIMSSRKDDEFGFLSRRFDGWTGLEANCTANSFSCVHSAFDYWWGDAIRTTEQFRYLQFVIAGNGRGDGIFRLSFTQRRQTWNIFNFSLLVSNASILLVLLHWLAALLALHRHFDDQPKDSRPLGIGVISNTQSFRLLPLILLPRLRNALTAFFTFGCYFEGDQMPLAEAWFVIYPGIAEVMLFIFSSINLIAKLTRRRVSDVLFGPTLIFFCVLHFLRQSIAESGLVGFDGRIPAAISSEEYDKITLLDFFTTNTALRLNGNVTMLFWTKMVVLGLNLVPLVVSRSTSVSHSTNRRREVNHAERVLAIQPRSNGGLGMSAQVSPDDLGAYDLVRHGYILYSDLVVISIPDWIFVLVFSLLGFVSSQLAVRVLVLPITSTISAPTSGDTGQKASWCRIGDRMRYISVHDPLIKTAWPWEISATQIH